MILGYNYQKKIKLYGAAFGACKLSEGTCYSNSTLADGAESYVFWLAGCVST